ncbi:MAG: hypothetical protein U5R31_00315 [Acidimicrobiia bacterium]|nr:hypothetical protein [Acidimicrobiia bacterium]
MIASSTSAPSTERGEEARGEPEEVVPGEGLDQDQRQHGQGHAEVALGEVEDAVRPVDEGHPHRDERAQQPDGHALDEHAVGHGEEDLLHREDDRGGDQRRQPPSDRGRVEAVRQPRHSRCPRLG